MIRISDHALVRYLERIEGIDIENFRRTMTEALSSPSVERLTEFAGDSSCRIKAGDTIYCIRGRTVTTCVERRRRKK